jgi:hypothetical protein
MLYKLSEDKNFLEVQLSSLGEAGWLEKDLEDVFSDNIDYILRDDQLMTIFQERKRQEEPDILALDAKGTLYIFELKRWQSDQGNLLQVIRYGQIYGQYDYKGLQELFRKLLKDSNVDLREKHQEKFELTEKLEEKDFNRDQQFIIVTAGTDIKTIEALNYWKNKGLPIRSITYHVYKHVHENENSYFLEMHSYSPSSEEYSQLFSKNYVVNTCRTYIPGAYKDMLDNNKAAAYEDRKHVVDKIQTGDKVFLYHNGVGFIAYGRAVSGYKETDINGSVGGEHYIQCKFEVKVNPLSNPEKAVSAYEIQSSIKTNLTFRRTAFSITDEIAKIIEELLKSKNIKTV